MGTVRGGWFLLILGLWALRICYKFAICLVARFVWSGNLLFVGVYRLVGVLCFVILVWVWVWYSELCFSW